MPARHSSVIVRNRTGYDKRDTSMSRIKILAIIMLLYPANVSAQDDHLQCSQSRICYDTLPCAGVENPDTEYCRDRLSCDILEDGRVAFRLEFRDDNTVLRGGPLGQSSTYNVIAERVNEYTADYLKHTTLSQVPTEARPALTSFIYIETRGQDSERSIDIVTVDISIDPERATTTTYGSCLLAN